jgi:hypothetical protein
VAGHTVLLGACDPDRGEAAAAGTVRPVRLDVTDPARWPPPDRSPEHGGAAIIRQLLAPPAGRTGVFLSEAGGTYPW